MGMSGGLSNNGKENGSYYNGGYTGFRIQGDLANGLIMGRTRVTMWVMGVISLLSKSP